MGSINAVRTSKGLFMEYWGAPMRGGQRQSSGRDKHDHDGRENKESH